MSFSIELFASMPALLLIVALWFVYHHINRIEECIRLAQGKDAKIVERLYRNTMASIPRIKPRSSAADETTRRAHAVMLQAATEIRERATNEKYYSCIS